MPEHPSLAHQRLAVVTRRLEAAGAVPSIPLDEQADLDPEAADRTARAEGDRLVQLLAVEAEATRPTPRRPQPKPPPSPDPMAARIAVKGEMSKQRRRRS